MLPLAFAALAGGAVLLLAGMTGSSVASVAKGKPDRSHRVALAAATGGTPAPAASARPTAAQPHGSWQAVLREIAGEKGWDAGAWEAVVQRESGGDPKAVNSSSGAFGLGQFLGSTLTEYAPYGATSTNPAQQIKAMGRYIADRYGTPTKALEHENAYGWY